VADILGRCTISIWREPAPPKARRTRCSMRPPPTLAHATATMMGSGLHTLRHYGLLYDDYTPKPAFDLYRLLIARYA
jgi:hypothetical protein